MKPKNLFLALLLATTSLSAQTFQNPILHLDYSDPDVCRVGDDFYMTASSFNCIPGLPVLHSTDLVNWTLISYAIPHALEPLDEFAKPGHGNGVWAPAIRHQNNLFYIYWGDPDYGIFVVTSEDALTWSKPLLIKPGKGLIDPCPFWDEDGKAYLVHGWAGSRAGIKSILSMDEMAPDGLSVAGNGRVIFDGHDEHPTIEGPKMYKRNGYYYILAPAGSVKAGWQLAMRSKNPFGPYEVQIVMEQGNTTINGPHQGGYIELDNGEGWFIHFQDKDAYGRIVHLNPVVWRQDWPVMGTAPGRALKGTPVLTHRVPQTKNAKGQQPLQQTSDNFDQPTLGLQWQWHANSVEWWHFCDVESKQLKLFSVPNADDYKNLWNTPNLLMQKFPAEAFTATTKVNIKNLDEFDVAGFVVMGQDYSAITIQKAAKGFVLNKVACKNAYNGTPETIEGTKEITNTELYLRVTVKPQRNERLTSKTDALCEFSYSLDGKTFTTLGSPFTARAGRWIGAKIGYFCNRTKANNDGGNLIITNYELKITN